MKPYLIFPYFTPILVESLFSMPEVFSHKLDTKQYPSLEMIQVEGGSFLLDDRIKCRVSNFKLGKYLVSKHLWEEVLGENPSRYPGLNLPVEQVSWYDSVEFCNRLSERQGLEPVYLIDKNIKDPHNKSEYDKIKWHVSWNLRANGFRLPTEAEWEYAARGGKYTGKTEYTGSGVLKEVGWFGQFLGDEKNTHGQTEIYGLRIPNELGIYDMSGNVWEWCWDWRYAYPSGSLKDPRGPESGSLRVLRGGSWINNAVFCRVANRLIHSRGYRGRDDGLRLARTVL